MWPEKSVSDVLLGQTFSPLDTEGEMNDHESMTSSLRTGHLFSRRGERRRSEFCLSSNNPLLEGQRFLFFFLLVKANTPQPVESIWVTAKSSPSGHRLLFILFLKKHAVQTCTVVCVCFLLYDCVWPFNNNTKLLYTLAETGYGVKTRVIDVDFTCGKEIYDRIGAQLQDLDVGVLVNNVGMSYSYPEFFSYLPDAPAFCTRLMHCNILSVTGMTLLLLPKMAEKRKGLILNVSSASAVLPSPLLSMYSSTKVSASFFFVNIKRSENTLTSLTYLWGRGCQSFELVCWSSLTIPYMGENVGESW